MDVSPLPDAQLLRTRCTASAVALAVCVLAGSAWAQVTDPAGTAPTADTKPANTSPVTRPPAATTSGAVKATGSGGNVSRTETAAGLPAGNSEQPINLEAASSDFDYKNNALLFRRVRITQGQLEVTAQQASASGLEFANAEWRLQGDVKIKVPGGMLQSNEARVKFRNNEIVSATIRGEPAAFEQRLQQNNQLARGHAATIDYNVKQSTVQLQGNAWLTDGQNEINGNTLVYDIARERVQANPNEKDPGGVRITINPPRKNANAPPTKGTGT
jgi:lipopolysaccharide transport protein LptA